MTAKQQFGNAGHKPTEAVCRYHSARKGENQILEKQPQRLSYTRFLFLLIFIVSPTISMGQHWMAKFIPNEMTLDGHDITDYNEQTAFMQWIVQNPVIGEEHSEYLANFVQSPSNTVSSAARSIMVAHNLLEYNEPYLSTDLTKSAEVKKPKAKPDSYKAASLKVYPNPANQFLTIEYNTGAGNSPAIIEVIDESGRRVYYQNLGRQFDQIILDTRNFKPGNYIIGLVSGSRYIGNANVIISH